ncbi:MAG: AmmeMemoRadiSam system protein B [Planctomycetota bacterium]
MIGVDRPRLAGVDVTPFEYQGESYYRLSSREGLSEEWLMVPQSYGPVLRLLDGRNTLAQVRTRLASESGYSVTHAFLTRLLQQLDQVFLVDTARYRTRREEVINAFRRSSVREPSHAGGAYPREPEELRATMRKMFEDTDGPGLPRPYGRSNGLRGILSPHIDFRRGGSSFAWGFKELAERSHATLFVVIGTSHYSMERFVLSKKDYKTPLGIAKTDTAFVERVANAYGAECFADELAIRPEHSIEFQVLFLQYLFEGIKDFTIVPLLVGSFHDSVESGKDPRELADIRKMGDAIREAERACGKEVCYVSSGDLAHIGMKFGDPWLIDEQKSEWCRSEDKKLLEHLETADPAKLHASILRERDRRRICGYPPTFMMLEAAAPQSGKTLQYDQFVDPNGFEIVSFASMAFYRH